MATSGSYDYGATAAQIIYAAAENLQLVSGGSTINTNDESTLLRRLNFIAKQWQGKADMAQGLKVHTRQRLTLFLASGQQRYTIGPASTDARCTAQYGRTTLSAAEASGQTTLSITSNTDTTTYPGTTVTMTNGDIIGVVQDDGTIHWSTISGTPGATATIVAATTAAASSGNYVYWFTSRAQRFPVIESAVLREFDTTTFGKATDTPLGVYTDVQQYEALTDKTSDGDPMNMLVEPLRLNTAVTFDCQPDDVSKVVNITALYPAEDYDATTDDIAFPQEWFAALEWELTFRCSPLSGKTWTPEMQQNYTQATAIARQVNPEDTSKHFEPGRE
jgi:hypothetical protein